MAGYSNFGNGSSSSDEDSALTKLSKPKLGGSGAVNSFAKKKVSSPGKLGSRASKLEQTMSKLRAKGATI